MKPKLLTTIRDYSWRTFLADALAGLTVALVALPLSIAIAIASGADPSQASSMRLQSFSSRSEFRARDG